jgi:hypothetical protein
MARRPGAEAWLASWGIGMFEVADCVAKATAMFETGLLVEAVVISTVGPERVGVTWQQLTW